MKTLSRRQFMQGIGAGLGLVCFPFDSILASSGKEELRLGQVNRLRPGQKYFFPRQARHIGVGATCILSYEPSLVSKSDHPEILCRGFRILSQSENFVLDVPGTYVAQYLGPDLGWNIY